MVILTKPSALLCCVIQGQQVLQDTQEPLAPLDVGLTQQTRQHHRRRRRHHHRHLILQPQQQQQQQQHNLLVSDL